MPNQKQRRKKDGTNKIKKTERMRAKEAQAKPPQPPSATGKGIRETSKLEWLTDRLRGFNRA